jgi:type IV pilus assembly protein PilW
MNRYRSPRAPGFSLIELLVAMAIGLILTLAITSVMIRSEGSKRSTTSVNDINQSGAYATYVLDRYIRSAGSGYSQSWDTAYGCLLNASKAGSPVLPLPSAIPASSAFANVILPIRLAPLIIAKNKADTGTETRGDVLIAMGGTSGVGESPQTVLPGSVTTTQLSLPTTLGYVTKDVLLLADPGINTCLITQVGGAHAYSDAGQVLPLGGDYLRDPSAFGANTVALQLGRADDNPPQFQMFGVGANNTLFSHDLLKPPNQAPAAISDNIVELRGLYGVDINADGKVDSWVDATGTYDAAALTDGSAGSRLLLRQIVAVRVGMILRTALQERSPATSASGALDPETFGQATAASRTLFDDPATAAFKRTRPLTAADTGYRFRSVEATIPLRNVLMAP